MKDNPYLAAAKFKPYPNSVDDIVDEESAFYVVSEVFKEISRRFGEEKAREIFSPYGRFNNKDRTAWRNARMIWDLYHMDKPNISEFARKHSGKGKHRESEVEALRKKIQRALNKNTPEGRRVRAAVRSLEELAGYPVLPDSVDRQDVIWKWLKSRSKA
jgi:hypothetical protein